MRRRAETVESGANAATGQRRWMRRRMRGDRALGRLSSRSAANRVS
ncbi:hypothetical protein ACF3MZ_05755 [Paenibacillaceae bacterium WGS1546]